jgi:surfactin synthase thioesterase subunit
LKRWSGRPGSNRRHPGAEVAKQVAPAADLRYFDGGHFVLDEYADAIAQVIIETFSR